MLLFFYYKKNSSNSPPCFSFLFLVLLFFLLLHSSFPPHLPFLPPPNLHLRLFSHVQLVTLSGLLLSCFPRGTTASPLLTSSDSPGEAPKPSTLLLSDLITVARSPFFMPSLDCFCLSGYAINFSRAVTGANSTL